MDTGLLGFVLVCVLTLLGLALAILWAVETWLERRRWRRYAREWAEHEGAPDVWDGDHEGPRAA